MLMHALTACCSGPKFIMSAKKFVNKRTSYYLLSVLHEPEERGGDDIVGKVPHYAMLLLLCRFNAKDWSLITSCHTSYFLYV